jgi:hypothetical protein
MLKKFWNRVEWWRFNYDDGLFGEFLEVNKHDKAKRLFLINNFFDL